MSDVSLDRSGKLDDPDYISGLSKGERARLSRRNVFAFSLSVASHEVLQLAGLITGHQRIGGTGPQSYHAYPGVMELLSALSGMPSISARPFCTGRHRTPRRRVSSARSAA